MASNEAEANSMMVDYNFCRIQLDTIPPTAFFNQDTQKYLQGFTEDSSEEEGDDIGISIHKEHHPKNKRKHDIDQNERGGKKKKQIDPLRSKTVSQIQSDIFKQRKEEESYSKIKEKKKHKKLKKKMSEKRVQNVDKRQEAIRASLQERIKELQAKRGKLTNEEMQERKKLRKKQARLRRREKKNTNPKFEPSGTVNGSPGSPKQKMKPIYSNEGKLVFSKFDFSQSGEKEKSQSGLTGKDYKRLLEKVEKRQQHMEKLKEKDANLAKTVQDKTAWKTALHKSDGEKVKDDPTLLKKALKRKEHIKQKRKKKWSDRKTQEQKRMDAKQDKRQKNIQQRKQAKIDKKIKKAKKKGRIVPGF